jgi:predicted regulator of Ras-like GTPase activity (Roadblock/LC7/MglB family)
MTGLGEVLRGLARRSGVEAVLLLSGDGLPIEHAARGAFEGETVAALAATLAQYAARLGQGAARGELRSAVLEYAGGNLVLTRVSENDWLAILAQPDADLGQLLYDLRMHHAALGAML